MSRTTNEQGQCQVRSGTDRPCLRPAVVKIRGIPFCEPCAREQEAYFTIGVLTEEPRGLRDDKRLFETLNRMRQTERWRHAVGNRENPMPHERLTYTGARGSF